ncbi:MAG: electron transport complex subunit RsxC [gamma proteobacterium symbiont of Ctena orbiculata]|uniref:Ion-translocating oxidoreductase complex subunit C n=1 Tax=Candidatus Thiodiazotropha taylori TaxID=2792791 RepID=A0A944QTQ5_9GAMM|nr:electron transport complex subunit RsxC [Candidatus Thiodiazotropha taylori]PUB85737.1 MAG: electron transport complex subunit RsxC [gamma proteobacterium symbiont of Ctena orbiculata]MBT2988174.1 electron transport complex subunit RsxC [Candidatus Thiodiazotropha taylori]MBT2996072.1 electron transport complex subunit RsxC [Candidatus Thiodiazotropha taylori]MBT2999784.1 electron transport complex subunit RsxC [Candidatus Thiodiazotropha taylori]
MGLLNLLFGLKSFTHGIHPPYHKDTADKPIRRLAFPSQLVLPLDQHIGKPAIPLVKKGQEVVRGEPIAKADGNFSVPLHAPATGRVRDLELMPTPKGPKSTAIVLDVYEGSTQEVLWNQPREMSELSREEILQAIQDSGMVGLGGAAFPSHMKLTIPPDKQVDTLIVNGCECEPYLTCDHRIMLEYPKALIRGIRYAMQASATTQAIIGIEDNKMDAAEVLRNNVSKGSAIRVEVVETKYPQGSEKMLIKSLLNREVPTGGLPADVGVVVNNVGTLAFLGQLLPLGQGLIERVITVAGPGIVKPGNYLVPLGTPVRHILEQAGYEGSRTEFILGGPMMGPAVSAMDTPITKGTSGLLVLNEPSIEDESQRIWPCIRCARCVKACPMHLNPSMLGLLAAKRKYDEMAQDYHLNDCFECGCCSYVCPSNIPLVQYFRISKAINREQAA